MNRIFLFLSLLGLFGCVSQQESEFKLNTEIGYFEHKGVNVMAFDDTYPEGHQNGISIIMHGNRVATSGDVRFKERFGGSSPIPRQGERELDSIANTITTSLGFPDDSRINGFYAVQYPDIRFNYKVAVKGESASVIVSVDLDNPLPESLKGKLSFNLELYPGALLGKPWIMDEKQGIFPNQPNGPAISHSTPNDRMIEPYAIGKRLTVQPIDPYNRLTIETKTGELVLHDGRIRGQSGWFVVSTDVPTGVAKNAIQWIITPNVVDDWMYTPVVQMSQVGYHPNQPKFAIIELDKRETRREKPILYKITENSQQEVFAAAGQEWGQFLRYNYVKFDFTNIKEEGLYKIAYGASESSIFRIARDIYNRGVWQPVLEYFLPVQMCHMRVMDQSRLWHDLCHMDDAQMAPINHFHFDGYSQGPSTLTKFKSGDVVPGLNIGGWHDAGDDDLRVESQAGEVYILSMAYEFFNVNYDATTIDQKKRLTEILKSDGKNDILQQIENGLLSVVGAYRSMGRLYRGIITNDREQYRQMGDFGGQTDGIIGNADDRWVFTENNPSRELTTAAYLAASSRVMKGFNDVLGQQALESAREIFKVTIIPPPPPVQEGTNNQQRSRGAAGRSQKIHAAVELFLATGEQVYKDFLLSETEYIFGASFNQMAWYVARAEKAMNDANFSKAFRDALPALKQSYNEQIAQTPYGVPWFRSTWGPGWSIQRIGFQYYFLHRAYPDIFGPDMVFNAMNYMLGCHPGSNNMSFASGVGAQSAIIAYGHNRADWSHIPGGVISGTAQILPDFPELKEFPFLWQQTEYVMGGGSSHYMFLVLAAKEILKD